MFKVQHTLKCLAIHLCKPIHVHGIEILTQNAASWAHSLSFSVGIHFLSITVEANAVYTCRVLSSCNHGATCLPSSLLLIAEITFGVFSSRSLSARSLSALSTASLAAL